MSTHKPLRAGRGAFWGIVFTTAALGLSGCAVVGVTTSVVGLAAEAAIGTVRIVGKGVGKAADALLDDDKDDGSGITIRYRDSADLPPRALPAQGAASASAIATAQPPASAPVTGALNSPQ